MPMFKGLVIGAALAQPYFRFRSSIAVSSGGVPGLAHGLQAVLVNLLAGRKEVAPDLGRRGQGGQGGAERLDRQPAVVADAAQRPRGRGEVDVALAGRAAIVLRNVHVAD